MTNYLKTLARALLGKQPAPASGQHRHPPTRRSGWAGTLGGGLVGMVIAVPLALLAASTLLTTPDLELTFTDDEREITSSFGVKGTVSSGTIQSLTSAWAATGHISGPSATASMSEGMSGTLALAVQVPTSYTGNIRVTITDTDGVLGLTAGSGGWSSPSTGKFQKTINAADSQTVATYKYYGFLSVAMTTIDDEIKNPSNRSITIKAEVA